MPCKPLLLTIRSFVNFLSSLGSPQSRGSNPIFLRMTGFINRSCVRVNHPAKFKMMQKVARDWLTSILRSTFIPYVITFEHAAVLIWESLYSGERDTFDIKYSSNSNRRPTILSKIPNTKNQLSVPYGIASK